MSRLTFRVFEHETIRPGQRTIDGAVVPRNLDLDALARFCDAHPRPTYLRVGRSSVRFLEYVGYLQVGDIAFEILPKIDRGTLPGTSGPWRSALLEMLRVSTGMVLRTPSEAAQHVDRSSLIDHVAAAFLAEIDCLAREGLARGYRSHESNGTTFRGRLVVAENVRYNVVRPERFYVRFSTFDADIVLNQVLGEALRVVANLRVSESLHARAAQHILRFEELTRVRVTSGVFDRIALGRSTLRYDRALRLARLILEGVAPALTCGRTTVVALLFDMNVLWETFVAMLFLRSSIPGASVRTQEATAFWARVAGAPKRVRPDIVVRRDATGEVLLVVDTKWKVLDEGGPADDDLKQMFVYNELFECRDAVLLYPMRGTGVRPVCGTFAVTKGHICRTACLGLFEQGNMRAAAMQAEVKAMVASAVAATAS
jgi:5-methylcytosine-specific restriction enzyme subunit McrC